MQPLQQDEDGPIPANSPVGSGPEENKDVAGRSLLADFEALVDDARTWFDAEIGYQKSRAGFVAGRIKVLFGLGLGALFFIIMALFGLVVGLIVALSPLITAWGATAVVAGTLLLCAGIMVRKASMVWRSMVAALDEKGTEPND